MIAAASLLVVLLAGTGWWFLGRSGGAAAGAGGFPATRVAVLYFDNLGQDQLKYMADGLTESLIEQLMEVNALDVVSRSGVGQFRVSKLVPYQ